MIKAPVAGEERPTAAPPGEARRGLAVPGSRPYPWPYDGAARSASTALLVVAPQAGTVGACAAAESALAVVRTLATAVARWGATVIITRHFPSPAQHRPSTLAPPGTPAAALVVGVPPPGTAALVVDAHGVDAFAGSPLTEVLTGRGLTHLLVCGLGLEGAVHSTLRSANDRGFECLLVADACAAADPSLTAAALLSIEMSGGIFGAVADSPDILSALPREEDD